MIREDLSRNFGYLVNDVARLLRIVYDRRVQSLGLTRSQWWVLNHIFRHPGVTQSELAAILEVRRPTLGRLLDRLQAKGWVRREDDARDRRAWRVHLTAAAEPVLDAPPSGSPFQGLRAGVPFTAQVRLTQRPRPREAFGVIK